MKNLIFGLVATLFLVVPTTAQEETTKTLDGFNELKVYDQINVTLIKSEMNKAVITGDDTDEVKIVNKDGRLKIRMELDNLLDGNETNVTLYHTSDLNLVDANEGAKITSNAALDSRYLVLKAQEGGEIIAEVDTQNLEAKAVTGGKINLEGSAVNQNVMVRTGADYNAKAVYSKNVDVSILAGGTAVVTSEELADANVTAGGTIEIFGNPEVVKEDKTLGGSIIVRS